MSADFNTNISVKGSAEEMLAILDVIRDYEAHNHDVYIDWVTIGAESEFSYENARKLEDMSADELKAFVENLSGELFIDASGPYGRFGWLEETGLFEAMAEAAPNAKFLGMISGFNTGGEQDMEGELIDGELHIRYKYSPDDEDWDDEEDEDDDFDEDEETEWDSEAIYDPVAKKYIKEGGLCALLDECDDEEDDEDIDE